MLSCKKILPHVLNAVSTFGTHNFFHNMYSLLVITNSLQVTHDLYNYNTTFLGILHLINMLPGIKEINQTGF